MKKLSLKKKISLAEKFIVKKEQRYEVNTVHGLNGSIIGTDGHTCIIIADESVKANTYFNTETKELTEIPEDNSQLSNANWRCNEMVTGFVSDVANSIYDYVITGIEPTDEENATKVTFSLVDGTTINRKLNKNTLEKILSIYGGVPKFKINNIETKPVLVVWNDGCKEEMKDVSFLISTFCSK